jgi:hypothetical protein
MALSDQSRRLWPTLRLLALAAIVLAVIAVGASEHNDYPSDDDILAPAPSPAFPLDPVALAGLRPNATWTLRDTDARRIVTVESRVTRTQAVKNGRIAVVSTRINDQPAGDRLYRVGPAGFELLGIGGKSLTRLEPPLPLLHAPLHPGEFTFWQGAIRVGKAVKPAIAVIRFAGPDALHTPIGTLTCYRIDLALRTALQSSPQHTVLWFSPRVGIVSQYEEREGQGTGYELVSYQSASTAAPDMPEGPHS